MAVACEGFFDFVGAEVGDLQIILLGSKHDDATCMTHDYGGGRVFVVRVELFDGKFVRFVLCDNFGEVVIERNEARFDGIFGGKLKNACFNKAGFKLIGVEIDDAVACDTEAGVDAHDTDW